MTRKNVPPQEAIQDFKFSSVIDLVNVFKTEATCMAYLEKMVWQGKPPVSPFDPTSKVYKCKGWNYRCKSTGRYFTARYGTMFDSSRVSLRKWFMAIWLLTSHKKGISSHQLAKDIKVCQKTAWYMLQRMRSCCKVENDHHLSGRVEGDETYVGGAEKNKHHNKRTKGNKGRSTKTKTPVLGIVQRGGKVVAYVVESTGADHLTPFLEKHLDPKAVLYTDEWLGYERIAKRNFRMAVYHGRGEYVNGEAHTNTIEGFWSLLKRGIFGVYHSTSKRHLQRYVDEFVFRYNTRKYETEGERLAYFLSSVSNRYLSYEELTGKAA